MLFGQVLTTILAISFLRETIPPLSALGLLLIFSGVSWLIYKPSERKLRQSPQGFLYAAVACLCMSVSFILIKKIDGEISPISVTTLRFLGGFIAIIPIIIISQATRLNLLQKIKLPVFRKTIVMGVLCSTLGGFLALHLALNHAPAFFVNALIATEPLFIVFLGAFFYNDKAQKKEIIASVIAIAGLILLGAQ